MVDILVLFRLSLSILRQCSQQLIDFTTKMSTHCCSVIANEQYEQDIHYEIFEFQKQR